MSATMNSIPGPATSTAAATQLPTNGVNELAGPANIALAADANGHGKSDGSFSTLFQQLIGKQALADSDVPILALPPNILDSELVATAEDLDVLLPFLEALGLAKNETQTLTVEGQQTTTAEPTSDMALTALAAITPEVANTTAISAANATTTGNGSQSAPLASLPVSTEDASSTSMQNILNNSAQAKETPAGREFAAQLVAAIEGSKEQAPGNIANALQQVIASDSPRSIAQATTPTLPIAQTVGDAGWSEEVGNRVVWMASHNESRAELTLNPPQMGRVEVSLSVTGDHATANFVSANPAVREALEAALPRLREVLAEAGIQLGQSQVGAENAQQSAQQEKSRGNIGFDRKVQPDSNGSNTTSATVAVAAGLKMSRGLVDVFA